MDNIAVVVVAYNREKSLCRLLESLQNAQYDCEVPLIISIDYSGSDKISRVAKSYNWLHGEKIVIEHDKNLGLREHVLSCGKFTSNYRAIIVLEDDIYVSPYFYKFAKEALNKYEDDDRVAGISLYSHLWNVCAGRPFVPLSNGYDAYFLQFAQSWGQVWTHRMWSGFCEWYKDNKEEFSYEVDTPDVIADWPKSSWLKYHIKYLIKTNKYFVYPYISLTTNFNESGTHNGVFNTSLQVPLLWNSKSFDFIELDKSTVKYDAFFEYKGLGDVLNISEEDLCVDLYQAKDNRQNKRYWLTTKIVNKKIIKSYALNLRPHELNVHANIQGDDIYLYDTADECEHINKASKNEKKYLAARYDVYGIGPRSLYILFKNEISKIIRRKFKK